MHLTVVIPTYKRDVYLARVLHNLMSQDLPQTSWEVLVVDNAGQERTKSTVITYSRRFPVPITYIYEPRLGLNHARNAGVKRASGELIAFLDDDMVPAGDWVKQLIQAFSVHADADCIGGKVEPLWETIPPGWFSERFLARLAVLDLSEVAHLVQSPQYICGGNACYRASVFERVGLFESGLDRKGKGLLSSGEVELCLRLERRNGTIYYCPGVVTRHSISEDRTQRLYLFKRGYWQAVTDAIIDSRYYSLHLCWVKLRRRFIDLFNHTPKLIRAAVIGDQVRLMVIIDKFIFTAGYIHGVIYALVRRLFTA